MNQEQQTLYDAILDARLNLLGTLIGNVLPESDYPHICALSDRLFDVQLSIRNGEPFDNLIGSDAIDQMPMSVSGRKLANQILKPLNSGV